MSLTVAELESLEPADEGPRPVLLRQTRKDGICRTASVVHQHDLLVVEAALGDLWNGQNTSVNDFTQIQVVLDIFNGLTLGSWAVVLAQLVERSLPTPEVHGSNLVIVKLLYRTFGFLQLKIKVENNEKTLSYIYVFIHELVSEKVLLFMHQLRPLIAFILIIYMGSKETDLGRYLFG